MPINPTYPGVYVEEIPSGVRSITGVATSIAAFIGDTRRGDLVNDGGDPVQVFNVSQFADLFGELDDTTGGIRDLSHLGEDPDYFGFAVNAFFANGGSKAYIVPVAAPVVLDGLTMMNLPRACSPALS